MQRALETLKLVMHVIRSSLDVNNSVCSTAAVGLGFADGEGLLNAARRSILTVRPMFAVLYHHKHMQ